MAIYRVAKEVVLLPYKYTEGGGLEANHETPESELAVNERGNPETAIGTITRESGRLVYTDAADFDKLTDEEKENAFYTDQTSAVQRMANKGSLVEVEREAPSGSKSTAKGKQSNSNS